MDGISVLRGDFPRKWKRVEEVPQFYMKTAYAVFNPYLCTVTGSWVIPVKTARTVFFVCMLWVP